MDLATGTTRPLTANPYLGHLDKEPACAPDGSQIVFVRERALTDVGDTYKRSALFVVNVDGSRLPRLPPGRQALLETPAWSPNGSSIVFHVGSAGPSALPDQIFAIEGRHTTAPAHVRERVDVLRAELVTDGTTIVFTRFPLPMGGYGSSRCGPMGAI